MNRTFVPPLSVNRLDEEGFAEWSRDLGLKPQALAVIGRIRSLPPSRRVQGRGSRKHNFAATVWNHNLAGMAKLWSYRQRSLYAIQWGLIPYWAKDPEIAYRTINARAETVDKAPSFRRAFAKRRGLIPADGF